MVQFYNDIEYYNFSSQIVFSF